MKAKSAEEGEGEEEIRKERERQGQQIRKTERGK